MTQKDQIRPVPDPELYYTQFYRGNEKLELKYMDLFWDKGSGFGIFLDPDPDLGDPKRPDLTGSGFATMVIIIVIKQV